MLPKIIVYDMHNTPLWGFDDNSKHATLKSFFLGEHEPELTGYKYAWVDIIAGDCYLK